MFEFNTLPWSPGKECVKRRHIGSVMGGLVWDCPNCPGTTPGVRSYQMTIFYVQEDRFPNRVQKNISYCLHLCSCYVPKYTAVLFLSFQQILAECLLYAWQYSKYYMTIQRCLIQDLPLGCSKFCSSVVD